MNTADFIAPPCECPQCRQAGVSARDQRRDPHTGKLLHGYELKHWYEQHDKCFAEIKALFAKKGMQ